jgi:membrane fusion protein, heavy metal efflux system
VIEAADTVQAQNDFIAAMTATNKAKSTLDLADIQYKRAKDLYEGKAVPLKHYQQAEANLVQAQNDMRSSKTALEAARKKLPSSASPTRRSPPFKARAPSSRRSRSSRRSPAR